VQRYFRSILLADLNQLVDHLYVRKWKQRISLCGFSSGDESGENVGKGVDYVKLTAIVPGKLDP
jgi:hypothetical protein